ncbi:MAG: hypothetical protein IPK06_02995 [Ignavibacteriae bacterium]|nr:hypothetical protein [Ignavibacteriota bacterium]
MKKLIIALLVSMIISCNKENPTETNKNYTSLDTLSREIKEGIFLSIDSLKDTYSLDETISAKVTLKNITNEIGLPIYIPNWPPYLDWHILDKNKNLIKFYPSGHGFSEYEDTLNIGEILFENVDWNIVESNSHLKSFSGEYILEINFNGISFNKTPHLIKHFKINEIGEAISTYLKFDYESTDSIKLDLYIRNRISKEITVNNLNKESKLYLIKQSYERQDTVYRENIKFNWETQKLNSKSDIVLYKYKSEKTKFHELGIKGGYYCKFHLLINGKKYISSNFIFI